MATFRITAMYEYEGVLTAKTKEEAEKKFLADLNQYYTSTESLDILEVCSECEDDVSFCDCAPEDDDEEDN